MQFPEMNFAVSVHYTFTLKKTEEVIEHINHYTPHITPESFSSLIVCACSFYGTASTRTLEDIHHDANVIVFATMVCPYPRWDSIPCHCSLKHSDSAAAVVVGRMEEHNKATEAIYAAIDNYPPPKWEQTNIWLKCRGLLKLSKQSIFYYFFNT